jgi:hypothetical protein
VRVNSGQVTRHNLALRTGGSLTRWFLSGQESHTKRGLVGALARMLAQPKSIIRAECA